MENLLWHRNSDDGMKYKIVLTKWHHKMGIEITLMFARSKISINYFIYGWMEVLCLFDSYPLNFNHSKN